MNFMKLGLLFTKFLLVQNGHNVVYLGSNVPYGSLTDVIEKKKIDATLLFAVTNEIKIIYHIQHYLNSVFKHSDHYVITHNLNIDRSLISNLKIVDDIDKFVEEISNK